MLNFLSYHRPDSLAGLYKELRKETVPVVWIAGGTDVLVKARNSDRYASCAVYDLTALPELRPIRLESGCLLIGSGTTHTEISESPLVQRKASALAQASGQVGACQLRNRATIGGNIANASPAGDTLGPLAVLNARLVLNYLGEFRCVPFIDFFSGSGQTALREKEFLYAIEIPPLTSGTISSFVKIGRRQALAISRLTLSAVLRLDQNNTALDLRLAIGAVFPRPIRFPEIEAMAQGYRLDDGLVDTVSTALSHKISEVAGKRASTEYKEPVCRLNCARLLREMRDAYGAHSDLL